MIYLYKFLKDQYIREYDNSLATLRSALITLYNEARWNNLSDDEKHRSRIASISLNQKINYDDSSYLGYAKQLVKVYEQINNLLTKIKIEKINIYVENINLLQLYALLVGEKGYINSSSRNKEYHIPVSAFLEAAKQLQEHPLQPQLNAFVDDYIKMYFLWKEEQKRLEKQRKRNIKKEEFKLYIANFIKERNIIELHLEENFWNNHYYTIKLLNINGYFFYEENRLIGQKIIIDLLRINNSRIDSSEITSSEILVILIDVADDIRNEGIKIDIGQL